MSGGKTLGRRRILSSLAGLAGAAGAAEGSETASPSAGFPGSFFISGISKASTKCEVAERFDWAGAGLSAPVTEPIVGERNGN